MSFRTASTCMVFIFCAACIMAQSVSLAGFNLESSGHLETDTYYPGFVSSGSVSGRFVPDSRIRFQTGFSFQTDDTEAFLHPSPEDNIPGLVHFDGASVTAPRFLDAALNFTVFTGGFDDPASGSLLRELLKVDLEGPEFLDMPVGDAFTPDTAINGTGLAATAVPYNRDMTLGMYLYWNAMTGADSQITGDLRFARAGDTARFNVFSGFSVNTAESGTFFRGGFSSVFVAPSGGELYAEAGIRSAKVDFGELSRNLYFLFEPRLLYEHADIAFTFFAMPVENEDKTVGNSTLLGTSLLVGFGNLKRSGVRGGIDILGSIDPDDPGTVSPFSLSVSPFCSFRIRDFLLNAMIVVNPLLLDDPETMGEIQISLKAVL